MIGLASFAVSFEEVGGDGWRSEDPFLWPKVGLDDVGGVRGGDIALWLSSHIFIMLISSSRGSGVEGCRSVDGVLGGVVLGGVYGLLISPMIAYWRCSESVDGEEG